MRRSVNIPIGVQDTATSLKDDKEAERIMLESRVVTGKVIDIRDGKVFTLHGDMVSTYHLGYYEMMNEEVLLSQTVSRRHRPPRGLWRRKLPNPPAGSAGVETADQLHNRLEKECKSSLICALLPFKLGCPGTEP